MRRRLFLLVLLLALVAAAGVFVQLKIAPDFALSSASATPASAGGSCSGESGGSCSDGGSCAVTPPAKGGEKAVTKAAPKSR